MRTVFWTPSAVSLALFLFPALGHSQVAGHLSAGPGCSFPSVGAAIAAAAPGETILVRDGVQFENLGTITKDLKIKGSDSGCGFLAWWGTTTIDGSGAQIAELQANVEFARITFRNGAAARGGLIRATAGSAVFRSCVLTGGVATESGGCVDADGADITLSESTLVTNCSAGTNGGGVAVINADLVVEDAVEMHGNSAADEGGAVFVGFGNGEIRGQAWLHDNTAHGGGAVCAFAADFEVKGHARIGPGNQAFAGGGLITNGLGGTTSFPLFVSGHALVEDNVATQRGGGITAEGPQPPHHSAAVVVRGGALVRNNTASDGGGVSLIFARLDVMEGGVIASNFATNSGGGVNAFAGSLAVINGGRVLGNQAVNRGGGLHLGDARGVLVSGQISGNSATRGAGVYVSGSDAIFESDVNDLCDPMTLPAEVYCTEIADNTASDCGGAVAVFGGEAVIDRTAILRNDAAHDSAIFVDGSGEATISNTLIADNIADPTTATVRTFGDMAIVGTTITANQGVGFVHSGGLFTGGGLIIWDNTDGFVATGPGVALWTSTAQSLTGPVTPMSVSSTSPGFTTTGRGRFRLAPTSSAINTGGMWLGTEDLDGAPRVIGPHPDRGAFEAP